MQENRWQQIEGIFNQIAVLPAAKRRALVEDLCRRDADLCREVMRLIESDSAEESSFLDEPIFSFGIQLLNDDFLDLLNARRLASYDLEKILGRGGMGAVFLAEDSRLERLVAIKVLPASLAADQQAILRFRQEARAASKVVHPNIAHIYEFGEANGRFFLAMEYARGQTLREILKENRIDESSRADIALQIARALQAAHRSGIVHRDIKPENIIVGEDGIVKVLDFGLAKLNDVSAETNQINSLETAPGIILGTTAYMSPEQVRGASVDYRSDIWSFGVILYEMFQGLRPFAGETASDIRAAILRDEPDYKTTAAPLKKIFRLTLSKEKNDRYQTVAELIEDLEKLKSTESGFKNPQIKNHTRERNSNFESNLPKISAVALIFVLLGGFFYFSKSFLYPAKNEFHIARINRLTNSGKSKFVNVSADGNLLAYSLEELNGRAVYLLARNKITDEFGGQPRQIIAPTKNIVSQLAFSPDKNFLYYKMRELGKSVGNLYRVALNGEARNEKVLDNVYGAPSFSPDGKRFVFFRLSLDNSHEDVVIADAQTFAERILYRRARPDFIPDTAQPVWSPDGTVVLIAGGRYADTETYNVYAINITDGKVQPILKDFWSEIWATCWIENGAAFIFTGRKEKLADNNQIWRASFPAGEVTRLTNDYNDYFTVNAANDNSQTEIFTMILQRTAQIYRADFDAPEKSAVALTTQGDSGFGLSAGANNRIFFGSMESGNPDIWSMTIDGGDKRQLTFDANLDSQPFAARNSDFVFFGSYRSGAESLWRMKADGSEQTLITSNVRRDSLAVSPDGKMIYYRSSTKEAEAIWRISADGGASEKFADGSYKSIAVSPDGKLLAATLQNEEKEDQLAILAVENPAAPLKIFKLAEGAESLEKIRFSPGGKFVVYIVARKGIGNLWAQPIDGSPPLPLTNFNSLIVYSFDFSADGKLIFYSRGELNGYAVSMKLE